METPNVYSFSNSPSSTSSSSRSNSWQRRLPPQRSALHSVSKRVITKKPIAPMPPTPPKIYKVDPGDFRDVVQRLTAAPEFQKVAPPPLSLCDEGFNVISSPSALAWCSSILLSPGTLASFETS